MARLKYALYARVSTEEQSNEQQISRLVAHADKMGWDYTVIEETESTRKTRPKKYELVQALRRREFDGVVVYKLDRWARSMQELIYELEEFHSKNIDFVSMSDNIDLSSSSGRLQFQILAAFAEFERSIISERTIEGLRRAVRNGRVLGRPKKEKVINKYE